MNAALPVFFTAYDPAELPGGTVDPLGITAGYLALADALFPGMTAAAGQATYFPMLCAGLTIAEQEGGVGGQSAARARSRRIEIGLRFERLWALACALQADNGSTDDSETSKVAGLRGIRYVRREIERLTQARAKKARTDFSLLAQQYRYGAFGIYSVVAEEFRLIDKATLAPSPGFGANIGRGFLDTTTDSAQRKALVRAAVHGEPIELVLLRDWGTRAHAGAPLHGEVRSLLREAALYSRERARTLRLIETGGRERRGWWSDRTWLEVCARELRGSGEPRHEAALEAALAYDGFLRCLVLIFERALWLCRGTNSAALSMVLGDPVLGEACVRLPALAAALLAAAERLRSLRGPGLSQRGRGILDVAARMNAEDDVASIVRGVLERHKAIQSAKFEYGRPKQVWIEERGGDLALTTSRAGLRSTPPESPDHVRAPDWRFGAALSLLRVVGGTGQEAA